MQQSVSEYGAPEVPLPNNGIMNRVRWKIKSRQAAIRSLSVRSSSRPVFAPELYSQQNCAAIVATVRGGRISWAHRPSTLLVGFRITYLSPAVSEIAHETDSMVHRHAVRSNGFWCDNRSLSHFYVPSSGNSWYSGKHYLIHFWLSVRLAINTDQVLFSSAIDGNGLG